LVATIEQGLGHKNETEEALVNLQGLDMKRAGEVRGRLHRIGNKTSNERERK
jgi:hypothetical protein